MFLHDTLLEAIICGNTEIPTDKYQNELQKLRSSSGLQSQFDLLSQITSDPEQLCDEEVLEKNLSSRQITGNQETFDACTCIKIHEIKY